MSLNSLTKPKLFKKLGKLKKLLNSRASAV